MSESLRDQLEANLDKIVTRDEDEVRNAPITGDGKDVGEASIPVPATPSGATGAAPESKISEPKKDSAGRLHGEDGKFVPKDEKAAVAAPKAVVSPSLAAPEGVAAAPAKPLPARPSSWKKDYWGHWDKLTSGGQLSPEEATALAEYMNQRETDFQHGVATYRKEWETARPLVEALQPFMPLLQQHRIEPGQWIKNLGTAHQNLALGSPQQKLQMFAKLAQDYGIPLQALVDQTAQQQYIASGNGQGQQIPPQGQTPLTREEALALWQQQFAQHASEQEVTRFGADPKYQHFEAVRETMAQLLEANLAEDLPSAYEAAIQHPRHSDIRKAIDEQKRAEDEEAKRKAEAERLAKAKGKAVSVRSSTPSAAAEEKPKGLRGQLEAAVEQHAGGGRV